jgi:hypothetical protein
MLISCFSPAHRTEHLLELYESLQVQDHTDWELLVLTNNGAKAEDINPIIKADSRVRIVASESGSANVGALKFESCNYCRGLTFLEADCDDIIIPGTLAKIAAIAKQEPDSFIYSDAAVFVDSDLHSWGYSPTHGWEHYPVEVYGRKFTATKNFDISPRSLCEVYYAPDHLRAWTREAYYKAGGHDPTMSVGDDHDLVCRTYLTGSKFKHIGGCGYLYRNHEQNTVKARGNLIAAQNAVNRRQHLMGLIGEWLTREKLPTLDLLVEWKAGRWNPDTFSKLSANHFGQIVASDVLQFVAPDKQVAFMNWAYAVLISGGWLNIRVPHERGKYASMNPLHKVRFNENSFLYYCRREFAVQLPDVRCRFDLVECSETTPEHKFQDGRTAAQLGMIMLRADLCVLKDQKRYPGPRYI